MHPIGAAHNLRLEGGAGIRAFSSFSASATHSVDRARAPAAGDFGPKNYGYRLGLVGDTARMEQAGCATGIRPVIDAWEAGPESSSALQSFGLLALFLLRREAGAVGKRKDREARKPTPATP